MILDELAAHARERVEADKQAVSPDKMRAAALALPKGDFCFEKALAAPGCALIAEVKKASPSKGLIAADFPHREIAKSYQAAGADCVSCLTEPKWFLGSDEIFRDIRQEIALPMLRKDFTVDEYQIYQAKVMGANAVLLICALMDTAAIKRCLQLCDALGLSALVETHDETEIESALLAGARVVGVNNRNLKNFTVDFSNAGTLRALIPSDRLFVAESGVSGPADAAALRALGADAILVGECLMRAADRTAMVRALKGEGS